jgi:hypothetical protein
MVDHMCEPILSRGFASSQLRRAHQDGVKTPPILDKRGGSAFLPADLDQMLEVREDHAGYIGSAPSLMGSRR